MIRVGICDDVEEDLRRTEKIILQAAGKSCFNIQVGCFLNGEDLLKDIERTGSMDIVFLDIYMKEMSGVETARCIRQKDFLAILIFVSIYDQYCKELISLQPFAFLDKPVSPNELEQVFCHALERKKSGKEVFQYTYRKVFYRFILDHIRYFESKKRKICIHTVDGDELFYGKLDDVERQLQNVNVRFIRIHQSFLVSELYVKEIWSEKIVMNDGRELLIGKKYRKALKQYVLQCLEEFGDESVPG